MPCFVGRQLHLGRLKHGVVLLLCVKSVSCSVMSALCDPMDCRLPGSSAHGIVQARILEWVDIPFSRGSS